MQRPIESFYRDLGQRIRQHRGKLSLSQERLAQSLATPMTRASIANIESGKQRVLAHTLIDLATALRTTVADLMPSVAKDAPPHAAATLRDELHRKLPAAVARIVARTTAQFAREKKR